MGCAAPQNQNRAPQIDSAFFLMRFLNINIAPFIHLRIALIGYVRDNVKNAGHYQENKPRQGEQDTDVQRRCLAST